MILEIDNKGAVYLVNNNSVRGRTLLMETRHYFLRQLKEEGIVKVIWAPGAHKLQCCLKNATRVVFLL
jgi:hypothetical protein